MFRRTAGLAAALAVGLTLSAPTAQALTTPPAPLTLDSGRVGADVSSPPEGEEVVCDALHFLYCGTVTITVQLSGFDGRQRPAPGEFPFPPLSTYGTADVTRVYGCETEKGRRLHRFDTTVSQPGTGLTYRRNMPRLVPATDAEEFQVYAFLPDAQPGNCPTGTSARLYRLTARNATFTMESRWAGIPASTTYVVRGQSRWRGSAPTPTL